jgi:hypothetical protein
VDIATAVRRHKTENRLHLSAELERLQLVVGDQELRQTLSQAQEDIRSITRAKHVEIGEQLDGGLKMIKGSGVVTVALTT